MDNIKDILDLDDPFDQPSTDHQQKLEDELTKNCYSKRDSQDFVLASMSLQASVEQIRKIGKRYLKLSDEEIYNYIKNIIDFLMKIS